VALARLDRVSFAYPHAKSEALRDVSLSLEPGEVVALLGPSGSGKSTLIRALAGLVPHFHGGRFAGRVVVDGRDTRRTRPAELAGTVATVFQDPEDQVVMGVVRNEVAFGLENVGTASGQIGDRVEDALAQVGALHLAERRTSELSGGELQRVCLASALALRPRLLLLDEPTSQLDPVAAERFVEAIAGLGVAVVLSEQRVERALSVADRLVFVDRGRVVLDGACPEAIDRLRESRPQFVAALEPTIAASPGREAVVALRDVAFAYAGVPVLDGADLEVGRGEIVALEGVNGSGKTTLAKLAAGLLTPDRGVVRRSGRACYLSQDPGRYLVKERVEDEVALGVGGDLERARETLGQFDLTWAARRHPRDLSSGERERLGLAAVAVAAPDLLVLDEPTRGIDPERKRALADWLVEYSAAGRGVLVATHDRAFPAHRRVRLGEPEVSRV